MSWDRVRKLGHFSTLFKIVTFLDSSVKLSLSFRPPAFYDEITAVSAGLPPCNLFTRPFVVHILYSETYDRCTAGSSFPSKEALKWIKTLSSVL